MNLATLSAVIFFLSVLSGFDAFNVDPPTTELLLCRWCGYNIAPISTITNIKSPLASHIYNQSLFGVEGVNVQSLVNPLGISFDIVTSKGGLCVPTNQKWATENSWYPGYAWKTCECTKCRNHVGWIFEPLASATIIRQYASTKGFYAFVLRSVVSESYADSLIAAPKVSTYT